MVTEGEEDGGDDGGEAESRGIGKVPHLEGFAVRRFRNWEVPHWKVPRLESSALGRFRS